MINRKEYYKKWRAKNKDKIKSYLEKSKKARKEYYKIYWAKKEGKGKLFRYTCSNKNCKCLSFKCLSFQTYDVKEAEIHSRENHSPMWVEEIDVNEEVLNEKVLNEEVLKKGIKINVNNIFSGILGFVMAMALTYLTYPIINGWLNVIEPTELQIFLKVGYVGFIFIICVMIPINLAINGNN